ncbi:MAG TPA: helix-turn-helix transcriptional regulator [Thermoanaerobaculia bacterium]|jgi:transcriptional regulator with XRE-family HTH domain|nr:helix-turn-helix transcriptional regulator [Thermoanaerobaculia bacterium]
MSRRKNPEEAHTIGLALMFLRRDAGLTLRALSAATGSTPSSLSRYEQGRQMPRLDTLRRIVAALDLTMADLLRAQQTVTRLPDGRASDEDGTLPPDTREPQAGMSRQAALRLAQEAGKAVAHCCLAFMELQAGGWHLPSRAGNGRAHAGRSAAGERHEVALLGEDRPDA